jgi:Ni/Co efflux regulator RcnB
MRKVLFSSIAIVAMGLATAAAAQTPIQAQRAIFAVVAGDYHDRDRDDDRDHDRDRDRSRYGDVVRCESIDNRRAYCRANTGGYVRLARQISDSACIKNRTWGSDRRGIWVDEGCRADFRVSR